MTAPQQWLPTTEEALLNLLEALSPLTIMGHPIATLDANLARRIREAVICLTTPPPPTGDAC